MDSKIAVKLQDEKSSIANGNWYERTEGSIYRNTQSKNSCKKSNSVLKDAGRMGEKNTNSIFMGSLAEVYEKALNNVLNIQPHIKMEESYNDKTIALEKRQAEMTENRHFVPPEYSISGTYKHPHFRHTDTCLSQRQSSMLEGKKLNTTSTSAFHVPEKRRPTNSLSRHSNWSHDHPFPYPVNYPADYYPVIHPPAFYSRGSPYHNAFIERMNYYPGPRTREYPVFTRVLPWTPFERDYKPWASPRYSEWRPKGTPVYDPETKTKRTCHEKIQNERAQNEDGHAVVPRPSNREKSADTEGTKDSNHSLSKLSEDDGTKSEKNSMSDRTPIHVDYNVKTRRMRAFQKRDRKSVV